MIEIPSLLYSVKALSTELDSLSLSLSQYLSIYLAYSGEFNPIANKLIHRTPTQHFHFSFFPLSFHFLHLPPPPFSPLTAHYMLYIYLHQITVGCIPTNYIINIKCESSLGEILNLARPYRRYPSSVRIDVMLLWKSKGRQAGPRKLQIIWKFERDTKRVGVGGIQSRIHLPTPGRFNFACLLGAGWMTWNCVVGAKFGTSLNTKHVVPTRQKVRCRLYFFQIKFWKWFWKIASIDMPIL